MRVMLGGGGTGGHINPALAIAKFIQSKKPESEFVFCGARGGLEEKLVPRENFRLEVFDIKGFRRQLSPSGIAYNLGIASKAVKSLQQAKTLIGQFKPDIVIGCGGYASFPLVYQAQRMKLPTAILEVNALPGVTTKFLARRAGAIMICFEESCSYFKSDNVVITGNPVREDILFARREQSRKELGLDNRPLIVSVWGSLGASEMNRMMADFIALESKDRRHNLIHAIGGHGYTWFPELVRSKGVDLLKQPGIDVRDYIYDMARVMAAADLVMCRAGAATLAELAVLGKPCILVPSPNVAENHQEKNAKALEREGAAVVLLEKDCTGEVLFKTANTLLGDPYRLRTMSDNIQKFSSPDAIDKIYQTICGLVRTNR